MKRKQFLKNGIAALGIAIVAPAALSCQKSDDESADTDTESGTCSSTPSETEGPFPTNTPGSLLRSDIRDDRTGVLMKVKIQIRDLNNGCSALAGALVDIWHCDKDGNYSEYGGTGLQSTNYTGVHFLRGRQVTDTNGYVEFTSIFPGWYNGRATHIHVHIYTATGSSLLVTQIAFPEGSSSAVATVNGAGGVAYGYNKGMSGYTYNANDNVFSDDISGIEIASVTGNLSEGYTIDHKIQVRA